MAREAQIPLALWISAALVFHAFGGGTTLEVAQTALDKQDLRNLVKLERQTLKEKPMAIELPVDVEPTPTGKEVDPIDKDPESNDDEVKEEPEEKKAEPKPAEPPKPKEEAPKPDVAAKPPPPPPEKKKDPVLVPAVPAPPAPPPPPPPQERRLAVMQHADKNQPDNPNAARIADDANHVAEETMAKIRSHDQDMENPSAGAPKALGPAEEKGNSDKDKEAESEDRIGDDDHAPGEKSKIASDSQHATPAAKGPMQITHMAPSVAAPRANGGRTAAGPLKAPSTPPPAPGGQGPVAPEVQTGGNQGPGNWSMDPANPGGDGKSRIAGRRRPGKTSFESPIHVGAIGLGGTGVPGSPNVNLSMGGVTAAVGEEQLRKERENDGASRRGEHAGRMKGATDFQKYRAAIENYDPSVKAGDKTSLNAARSPFASYLVMMHNKIHPLFGDRELSAMDSTQDKQFADQDMYSVAEIVLTPDGRVVRRGLVKNSGSTAFDTIVLKVIDSSAPYGKAPEAIVSPDGKVYLTWEFHRNHKDACATGGAHPIMKKASAAAQPATPRPPGAPLRAPKNTEETPGGPIRPIRQ